MKNLSNFFIVIFIFFNFFILGNSTQPSLICPFSIIKIESFEESNKKTTILLDNGILCSYKDTDLFNGENGWMLGDRISLVYVSSQGYFLQNDSCQGCIPVKLINVHSKYLKTLYIQDILKNEEKSTNTIILSDNTRWFIGSWSSSWMSNWQIRDRILVTPQEFMFGNADHLLINLDRESSNFPGNVRAGLMYSPHQTFFEEMNKREGRSYTLKIANVWQENQCLMLDLDNGMRCKSSLPNKFWQIGDNLRFFC